MKINWQGKLLGPITHLFEGVLTKFWAWRLGPVHAEPVPGGGPAASDNLQVTMNLIMPIVDTTAVGRAKLMGTIGGVVDELFVGMDNVGTVHFARFDIIGDNLCMISVFDGDPKAYIRDFIAMFGGVFNALMTVVQDPPPTPCEEHVDDFIEWVAARDAFHIPGGITSTFPDLTKAENAGRDLVRLMNEHEHVQLGIYRGYPGFSAAQIRSKLGVGW